MCMAIPMDRHLHMRSALQGSQNRLLAVVAGVLLFAWFLFLVSGGLRCWFDADDLMNMCYYWTKPWSALLKANLAFWSSYYRPAGGLFYRSIYALWGFHPLPFRIAVLALLPVNLVLAPWQRKWIEMHARAAQDMQGRYRRYVEQIHELIPAPRKGAHILLLSDADGRDDYDVCFAMLLYYGDPRMEVHRMRVFKDFHTKPDMRAYDYVLDWVDGRFVLVPKPAAFQNSKGRSL